MKPPERTVLDRSRRSTYAALTAVHDSLVVFASLAIGYAINFPPFSFDSFLGHQWKLVLYSIVLYVGLSAIMGVYRQAYSSPLRLQIAAAIRAYALGTLIIFATLFLFRNTYYSKGALLTYVVLLPLAFLSGRLACDRLRAQLQKRKWGLDPAIVVLVDEGAGEQMQNLATYPSIGFDVRYVLNAAMMNDTETRQQIAHSILSHRPTCMIYSSSTLDSPRLSAFLDASPSEGIAVRLVSPEVHDALTRMRLYDFAGIALSGPPRIALSKSYRILKRGFDLLFSAALVVAASPLLLVIGLAIRLESAGGVFFRQVRSLTQRSKAVRVFKFRSMMQNAEDLTNGYINDSQHSDEILFKSPSDPRITGVGRLIRRYSLDELPQLLNVIAGDMSLVGPRPLPVADFRKLP
ncbi:MAG: sugar transferase, partial [Bacteroidota bacterium]